MEVGEEDAVVAVEDSEDAVVSVDVEDSAELDSVEDLEEEGVDSEATGEVSVAVAGLEEPEEDSAEVGEDSVEATTEERAVLKSTTFHHHQQVFKFTKNFVTSATASAEVFLFHLR